MSLARRELISIRRMMREGHYVLTHHALDEMIADDLHVQDIEHIVLTGSVIRVEADRDSGERKFVILGNSRDGFEAEVAAKIKGLVVIITVYLL
ncbi:DUF4258 domain-containing protein [uncultured Thiodictyon sp.]|uniref:DUF4258 domain-containing protein n=1 Tax=uncultured Thiodictyon sp. TaxID=1846217 RepID=UPI0025E8BBA9|nr:DUF4258 domain-containing protein [uncultured Thiodictyon sp.]